MKWSKNSRSKASVWRELTCAISSTFLFKSIFHSSFEDELNLELLQEGPTSVSQKKQSRIVADEMQQMCKVRMCKVRKCKLLCNTERYSCSSIPPAQAAQVYALDLVKCIFRKFCCPGRLAHGGENALSNPRSATTFNFLEYLLSHSCEWNSSKPELAF